MGTVLNRAPGTDSYAYYHYGYEQQSTEKVKQKDDKKRGAPATATMNGNGVVVHDMSPVKFLPTTDRRTLSRLSWDVMQGPHRRRSLGRRPTTRHEPETLLASRRPAVLLSCPR